MLQIIEELDDVVRCQLSRRALSRRYRTLTGLCAHLRRVEKKRKRNLAAGRRLLGKL